MLSENDYKKYFPVFLYMMGESNAVALYFATPVVYDFKITRGDSKITRLANLVDKNISPQMVCIKILHRLSMMYAYQISYMAEHHLDFNNIKIDPTKKYSLIFSIGTENINVVNYKGFGFLCSNTKAFAWALGNSVDTLFNYVRTLATTDNNYGYLKIIVDFWNRNKSTNPDQAVLEFIKNNEDFYKNEIANSSQFM